MIIYQFHGSTLFKNFKGCDIMYIVYKILTVKWILLIYSKVEIILFPKFIYF